MAGKISTLAGYRNQNHIGTSPMLILQHAKPHPDFDVQPPLKV